MRLIPYKKLSIKSNLNEESITRSFESFAELNNLGSNQWYNNIFNKKTKKYVGTINGNRFKLEPLVTYSRTPFLRVKGCFLEQGGISKIDAKLTLPLSVKIAFFLIIFTGIFILAIDYAIKSISGSPSIVQEYPYILLFPLILYFIVIILFNSQSEKFLKRFVEHFEGEDIHINT